MKKLIKKIENWGYEQNLQNGNSLMQTTKILEECIELQQAIIGCEELCKKYIKNTKLENGNNEVVDSDTLKHFALIDIKDAIGGIFVTLVMLSIQDEDIELKFVLDEDKVIFTFMASSKVINRIAAIQICLCEDNKNKIATNIHITELIGNLSLIANTYGFTLKECVQYAFNERMEEE